MPLNSVAVRHSYLRLLNFLIIEVSLSYNRGPGDELDVEQLQIQLLR